MIQKKRQDRTGGFFPFQDLRHFILPRTRASFFWLDNVICLKMSFKPYTTMENPKPGKPDFCKETLALLMYYERTESGRKVEFILRGLLVWHYIIFIIFISDLFLNISDFLVQFCCLPVNLSSLWRPAILIN